MGLSKKDLKSIEGTAAVMAEELELAGIDHAWIWCSQYLHAREHAGLIQKALTDRKIKSTGDDNELMNPENFRDKDWREQNKRATAFCAVIKEKLIKLGETDVLILVGHQPQLGWLAEKLYKSLAIHRSEMACIRFRTCCGKIIRPLVTRLLWTIAPSDDKTFELLRDKIKSKMDTAKLLGTFIVFFLGIALGILSDANKLEFLTSSDFCSRSFFGGGLSGISVDDRNIIYGITLGVSVMMLFFAIIFYLMSMYAYDSLLMPTRFWKESIKKRSPRWLPRRPPSSSLLVLQVNMLRIWWWLFTPATCFVVLALIGFAMVVTRVDPMEYFLGASMLGVIIYVYYSIAKPRFGAED